VSDRLKSRAWLIPIARAVFEAEAGRAEPVPGAFADPAGFERWLVAELTARGIAAGLPADLLTDLGESADDIDYSRFALVNSAAHRLALAMALFRRQGRPLELWRYVALGFATLAHALQATDLAGRAFGLLGAPPAGDEARLDRLNAVAVALADRLASRALSPGDPLLGHPFHQILLYGDALCFGRVAWAVVRGRDELGGRPEPLELLRAAGLAQEARYQAIEVCIALAWADGVLDPPERQLIQALVRGADLGDTEKAMVQAELKHPQPLESLVAEVSDPAQRAFLLRLALLTAHASGELAEAEQSFLLRLAAAFHIDASDLDRYTAEALASYEKHTRVLEGMSLAATVRRLRASLVDRVEEVVKRNASKLEAEIRETSELGVLLTKACSAPLTREEKKAVRRQLLDICRTIPALAIFAAPGGAILLPIAVKHLPFKILPDNFDDRESLEDPDG